MQGNLANQLKTKGYVVLKNFVPKDIIDITLDNWKCFENNSTLFRDFKYIGFEERSLGYGNTPVKSLYKSIGNYCFPPSISMHKYLKERLKEVLDLELEETYSFARKYNRDAWLESHIDRPDCEISVTMCLDYKSDNEKPWKFWLSERGSEYNLKKTQMKTLQEREQLGFKSLDLGIGDVLLYLGVEVPHWRDCFQGEYSYHMFLHFYDVDSGKTGKRYDGRKNSYDMIKSK